jgi:hypothetical protein
LATAPSSTSGTAQHAEQQGEPERTVGDGERRRRGHHHAEDRQVVGLDAEAAHLVAEWGELGVSLAEELTVEHGVPPGRSGDSRG